MSFESKIKEYINEAIDYGLGEGAQAGLDYLKSTYEDTEKQGVIVNSPLLRIMDYPVTTNNKHEVTLLLKGNIKLFKAFKSIFVRMEVKLIVDKTENDPLKDCEIKFITVMGDLTIFKKDVFEAKMGFGVVDGGEYFVGHGALKLLPPNGFGLDIAGGFSDYGFFMDAGLDIPVPIPLGSTGLGLSGVNGLFAYNFEPKLENNGVTIVDPTAKDYVTWAKSDNIIDLWKADAENITSVGVGLGADLVTLPDNGMLLALRPIGLSVLIPGPIFILGGSGTALMGFISAEGYVVIDISSSSFAMGLSTKIDIIKDSKIKLIEAGGTIESYFSFDRPSDWYMNFGTEVKPVSSKMIAGLVSSKMYLMMDNNRIKYGASLSMGLEAKWWKIQLYAKAGAEIYALVGRNPVVVEAQLIIWAELGIKIWVLKFSINATATATASTPKPTQLTMMFTFKLDMPWFIPDVKASKEFLLGDKNPETIKPDFKPAILDNVQGVNLGLLHELSGKQWEFDSEEIACWPDATIVIPFSMHVSSDNIDIDIGNSLSSYGSSVEGAYTVTHKLTKLTLLDENDEVVPDIKATWVNGSGGDADKLARLHILSSDPYAWLVPHLDMDAIDSSISIKIIDQFFGKAPVYEVIEKDTKKYFNDIAILPRDSDAEIMTLPISPFRTRTIKTRKFELLFKKDIVINKVTLFLLVEQDRKLSIQVNGEIYAANHLFSINEDYRFVAITIDNIVTSSLNVKSLNTKYLLLQGIRYYEIDTFNGRVDCPKTILAPGKYTLLVEGESEAKHAKFANVSQNWDIITKTFTVSYPETLRPYIYETTIGDSRIFGTEGSLWNPTMYGYGFPVYKKYTPIVRFKVSYMDKIFSKLILRLNYEKISETLEYILSPQTDGESENFLPKISEKYLTDHCNDIKNDQMLEMPPLTKDGPANIQLLFKHPVNEDTRTLDEWTCYISKFNSFSKHIAWNQSSLMITYNKYGKRNLETCNMINPKYIGRKNSYILSKKLSKGFNRVNTNIVKDLKKFGDFMVIRPKEYSKAPTDWKQSTGSFALNNESSLTFIHYAQKLDVRFNNDSAVDILDGINSVTKNTQIEALVDEKSRPYALWLRTPEPLDWRRVKLKLTIMHVIQNRRQCPTEYANRSSLELDIKILPSPDASSAFLVGFFNGESIVLPIGVYKLELEFDQQKPKLPLLKPQSSLQSPKEKVMLKFVQPSGIHWPLPPKKWTIEPEQWQKYKHILYELDRNIQSMRYRNRILIKDIQLLNMAVKDMEGLESDSTKFLEQWQQSKKAMGRLKLNLQRAKRLPFIRGRNSFSTVDQNIEKIEILQKNIQMQINKF